MVSIEYRELIRSLCEQAGLQHWEDIHEDNEIRVDGVNVALLHDEAEAPDFLNMYFDMCAIPHDDDLKLRLLEHSMTSNPSEGRFGCLPMTDRLLYRATVSCNSGLRGDELLSLIRFHLVAARRGLAACGVAT